MEWSREEVEAIVADYLQMLALELAGQKYSKTEHRRRLPGKLRDRSDGAIEYKHCNISAVMLDLGFPSLVGYLPRFNYQALLAEVAEEQIRSKTTLDQVALAAVQQPAVTPSPADFSNVKTDAPTKQSRVSENLLLPSFRPFKRDYLEREAQNQSLGLAGEDFVVQYEHWRLSKLGETRLADRVEHVAKTKGDGLGFDVLSFDMDGKERFIEVKTTRYGRDTPFFVSRGELARSKVDSEHFHLYRLYEFRDAPRLFDLAGSIENNCTLDPISFRAGFR